MKSTNGKEFYKANELAKHLEVNVMTIYRYIKAGRLGAYKIGKEFNKPFARRYFFSEAKSEER